MRQETDTQRRIKLNVVKAPERLDEIEQQIRTLTEAMRAFNQGPLTKRCVIVLLQDITKLPQRDIKKVLDGIDVMESVFLKKKK